MNSEKHISDNLAAFIVSSDNELASLAASAVVYVPGIEYAGEFKSYLSRNRRPAFPAVVKQSRSSIAFVDFDQNPDEAIETVQVLSNTAEHRIVSIGVSSHVTTDLLLRAMKAGCSEFLHKPLDSTQVQETLHQWQGRLVTANESTGKRGKIVTFYGVKGGVGSTALCVQLGMELAKSHPQKVLIVDDHRHLGHVALYLGVNESKYHFAQLVQGAERIDDALLQGFLLKHPSGLDVLASADSYMADISNDGAQRNVAFEYMRSQYDVVLVDSSVMCAASIPATLEVSDEVVLVSTPEIAAIRDLSRCIAYMRGLLGPTDKLRVVINRLSSGEGPEAAQIEKAIGMNIHMSIPDHHPHVTRAINAGLAVSSQRKSEFSNRISAWSKRLLPDISLASAPQRKKLLGIWG